MLLSGRPRRLDEQSSQTPRPGSVSFHATRASQSLIHGTGAFGHGVPAIDPMDRHPEKRLEFACSGVLVTTGGGGDVGGGDGGQYRLH